MATRRKTHYRGADSRETAGLVPKTPRQKAYIDALNQHEQVFVFGPAGTGKTYIATTFAANLYIEKRIDKIILTRPNVASGRSLGYRPGTLEEKMEEWLMPILPTLIKVLDKGTVETALKNGNLEYVPFESMRGRSFEDAFIILDEAQNVTPGEMQMFLTRIGDGSRVVVNGDVMQSDLRGDSGLSHALRLVRKHDIDAGIIEFGVEDIVRSEICKQWIVAFMEDN